MVIPNIPPLPHDSRDQSGRFAGTLDVLKYRSQALLSDAFTTEDNLNLRRKVQQIRKIKLVLIYGLKDKEPRKKQPTEPE